MLPCVALRNACTEVTPTLNAACPANTKIQSHSLELRTLRLQQVRVEKSTQSISTRRVARSPYIRAAELLKLHEHSWFLTKAQRNSGADLRLRFLSRVSISCCTNWQKTGMFRSTSAWSTRYFHSIRPPIDWAECHACAHKHRTVDRFVVGQCFVCW